MLAQFKVGSIEPGRAHHLPLLVASSSNVVSTLLAGMRTYLTTDPLMKQFFTAIWGELASLLESPRSWLIHHVRMSLRIFHLNTI